MKDYPRTSFFRVVGGTTAQVRELLGVPNLVHIALAEFQNLVAVGKV
jgi:hypothetical protein